MNQERKQSVLKKGKNAFPIISSLELYYLEMFILLRLILLYYFCYFLHNEKALSYRIIKCTKRKKFLIRVQERNAELLKKYFFPSSLFLSLSFSFSKRSQKKSSFPRKSKSNMLQATSIISLTSRINRKMLGRISRWEQDRKKERNESCDFPAA